MKIENSEKIIKMALLHDLTESLIGELTPEQIDKKAKEKLENNAFGKIIKNLPEQIKSKYLEIWFEYQENISPEAKLIHQIDKLEMAMQAKFYQDQGISKKDLRSFFATADARITNKHLRQLLRSFLE